MARFEPGAAGLQSAALLQSYHALVTTSIRKSFIFQISRSETLKLRKKLIGRSCQLFFKTDPIKIVRAKGKGTFINDVTQILPKVALSVYQGAASLMVTAKSS